MIKTLAKSIREYKTPSILSPIFVSIEVILECLMPLVIMQFIAAMYGKAFFTDDINEVIQAGLDAIPADSWSALVINDVLKNYEEGMSAYDNYQYLQRTYVNSDEYNFYRLVITENGGSTLAQMSEWQLFYSDKIATGIDDVTTGDIRLDVYPNPVTDVLHVNMPAEGTLTIYKTSGQAVASLNLNAGENTIPFAQYGAGMYIVKAQAGSKTLTAKVIK